MAPKKAAGKGNDKAKATAKAKVVEDKTFGLKNKNKSNKVQKYVQQVQQQASQKGRAEVQKEKEKERKKAEEAAAKELAALFATTIKQPKVPVGVDPKSVVCEFYRAGQCTKGFKCKYSHDLAVERKGGKMDIYTDKRTAEEEKDEGMEDWDMETLENAIRQKHSSENKNRPTEIICKYFLDAVEKKQYGWFWQCPNGKDCKYRHALPPGYVLKSQMKMLLEEEAANSKSVEEVIEEERAKVDAKTPITEEVFKKWKADQLAVKNKKATEAEEERRRKGLMTGREIFAQEGFVATDDASATDAYTRDNDDDADNKRIAAASVEAQRVAREAADLASTKAETVQSQAESSAAATTDGGVKVELTQQEEEELFGDDDDDDDDDLLDELAADLTSAAKVAD